MINLERLDIMLAASHVTRFHSVQTVQQQSVGQHTFNMLLIADALFNGIPPLSLIKAITYHDLHEGVTGDIPNPVKNITPKFKKAVVALETLIDEAYEFKAPNHPLLKPIDVLELFRFVCVEQALGNKSLINNNMWNLVFDDVKEQAETIECESIKKAYLSLIQHFAQT